MCGLFVGVTFMVICKGHVDKVCMVSMGILSALVRILYLYLCSNMSLVKAS